MRIASVGHVAFAAILIAVGIAGLLEGKLGAIWQPVPKGVPAHEALAYLCASVSLFGGAGLLWARTAPRAARVLLAYLLIWLFVFRVPNLFLAPSQQDSWSGCGETMVIVAGAWVLYAWFASDRDTRRFGFATGEAGLRIARVIYALALIPFGVAHFSYPNETAALVPGWLPFRLAWAYGTGGAFLVTAAAILIRVCARRAAALSAVQMGLFTLLVWFPILARGSNDVFQWSETVLSAALTAAAWVVADSYRRVPAPAARRVGEGA